MEFAHKFFLAAIEEDDQQHSLFRVKPLLSAEGPIAVDDLDALGDEGCLRIVPDKQEQYSFKERMRGMLPLCLVDLRFYPMEAHKMRPNKNYAPARGETNRYVLYSDAVKPVDELGLWEVVSDPLLHEPLTCAYYLRRGGHIQGPFQQETGEPVDALSCIAPDSERLFSISLPDGRDRLFFWPSPDDIQGGTGGLLPREEIIPQAAPHTSAEPPQPDFMAATVRLLEYFEGAGFVLDHDEAAALLLAALTNDHVLLSAACDADTAYADALLGRATGKAHAPLTQDSPSMHLPRMTLAARSGFELSVREPVLPMISMQALVAAASTVALPLSDALMELLARAEMVIKDGGGCLSLELKRAVLGFLQPALVLLGGEVPALSAAFTLWLYPACRAQGIDSQPLEGILASIQPPDHSL